jgi:hypothetical protein
MYSKIKSIVTEFVQEHDLASKAKMDQGFLVDMLTVRLFDGLNQKEATAPRPAKPSAPKKPEPKPDENKASLLNLNLGEVAK